MIHHTENATTVKNGQAIATVIADSVYNGRRITTLELVYPRYIHSELMTHRMFSRNAASSRATPIKVMAEEVMHDPVFFDYVGKNQPGMEAGAMLDDDALEAFRDDWNQLALYIARWVQGAEKMYGIHKQTLNRVLEPFSRIRTLVTATEWANFFKLRIAPDAQPEMCNLACAMRDAMKLSKPVKTELHAPYSEDVTGENKLIASVARCARVSYARLDGTPHDWNKDNELFNRLRHCGHWSPFEHVAFAAPNGDYYANFRGWISLRSKMEH